MYALGTFPYAFLLLLQQYFILKPPTPFKIVTDLSFIQVDLDYNVDPVRRRTITLTADMVIKDGSHNRFLSFDDLMEFEDYQYLEHLDSRVYQAFPQPIDLVETYTHLVLKESIGEPPENRKPKILAIVKSVCDPILREPFEYDVIVLIQSMVTNFDKRQKIREFYRGREGKNLLVKNSIRYTFVFSVGYPSKRSDDDFETGDGIAVSLSSSRFGNVSTDFYWWYDKMRLLSEEIEKYDDILVGNYEDTFWNQTQKIHHSLAWVSLFCRKTRPIILLMDDNKLFNADNLARALSVLNSVQRDTLFYGEIVKNQEVKREGYWFASKTEVPWPTYPDYPTNYTILGFQTVEELTVGMYFTEYIPFADTYIGLVANRMRLEIQDIKNLIDIKNLHLRDIDPSYLVTI
ncbi:hypothetical protein Aperf_G00000081891 [Anoplocephala perfoliata]